ncbi:MAG: hypothetical protein J2P54_25055, partial [Bradyrhizobiaceae bacterium]|nr:hypothetical protein [Bradyrhizobiaceae bacterium]
MRVAIALSTVAIILGAFMAEATAQYYPPQPRAPDGAYRGAPMPDDEDDNGPPDVYPRPPSGIPNARERYHYGPIERYDPQSDSQEADTDANYGSPNYGGAPSNRAIEQSRLPDIGSGRAPVDLNANSTGEPVDLNPYPNRPPVDLNPNSNRGAVAALPPEDQPETGEKKELPPNLRRQLVDYQTTEPAGTIIIDTPHTY